MNTSYHQPSGASNYKSYLGSENGQIQQDVLTRAILEHLPKPPGAILDAGCGTGWLTNTLHKSGFASVGCDNATILLETAKNQYPHLPFINLDIQETLPFPEHSFTAVVANMVMHDVAKLGNTYHNIADLLTKNGTCIITIPNPYYSYPVGVWKRGWKKIFGYKPELRITPFTYHTRQGSKHAWQENLESYFYTLSHHLDAAKKAGLIYDQLYDIETDTKATTFNLHYQLNRFPILLLIKFKKG